MKFYIKQKVFTLKDQFSIMDESGNPIYNVQGKMFSFSNKLQLQNPNGSVVLHAKKQVFRFLPKYFLYDPHDEEVATIERKFGLRPKFEIQAGVDNLRVEGSFFAHSFQIYKDDLIVASIQKKLISWGDSYEIDINDINNTELYLFIVIVLDQIIHEQQRRRHN
ncbi:LURP-one-related/scramblase family protein [Candidatus Xianfuyuplasma coldseepsis]|uniref:LURP-one-related family protein n=1 Tax=Candidatus Xianfuyuplasma coldseepsis TaxID=2782163 RepID=A0A7L7KP66_9MOLU|nr:LURP-one-related family protein [Xianfuyuplasma coldseepsis]QMS84493.1 hypothetical protein G4Z02_01600 [Xianfuyuplasma coldseepsis]